MPRANADRIKLPVLLADAEGGTGSIKWPHDWESNRAILRADILKDWLCELEAAYGQAVKDMTPEAFRTTEH